ncbi:MAG: Ig-like domain-containing protein [Bacteroidia bacterium]|nr:Ig-like domain-containing protein [Bacteroidia bacterium]
MNRLLPAARLAACLLGILLLPAPAAHAQHPFANVVLPQDGSTGNSCQTEIILKTFYTLSEASQPDPATLTDRSILIYPSDQPRKPIRAGLSYHPVTRQIRIVPAVPLAARTLYTVEVTAGLADDRGFGFLPLKTTFATGDCAVELPPPVVQNLPAAPVQPDPVIRAFTGSREADTLRLRWRLAPAYQDAAVLIERLMPDGSRHTAAQFPRRGGAEARILPVDAWEETALRPGWNRYRMAVYVHPDTLVHSDTVSLFVPRISLISNQLQAADTLKLAYWIQDRTPVAVVIRNSEGKDIARKAGILYPGQPPLALDASAWPSGAYLALVRTGDQTWAHRFSVRR